ncbi:MAG: Cof-type HAD-IIB family hydrolase [Lachnospiraceae bacterium]|nr:Cof-type HAD-IIB family hydrolase [Lachnospiraceae bacterium]
MRIDREHIKKRFQEYVERYDISDTKIKLKYDHTYRVAELSDRIAKSLNLTDEDRNIAWTLGMFHDIGRFEQVRRYGTFEDAKSINHAALSADILYVDGLVDDFIEDVNPEENRLMEKTVRLHNVFKLPEEMTDRELLFAQILRDADKIDILKVNCDIPLTEIYNVSEERLKNDEVSDAVMRCALSWQNVDRRFNKTSIDRLIAHICLVYGLVYPESLHIVKEQGYLEQMLHFQSHNYKTLGCLKRLEGCMKQFMRSKDTDYKIVFTDIDGTFINKKKEVMPITKAAVHDFVKAGGELVLCSSRSATGMKVVAEQLDVPCCISAFGGALLIDENGQTVYEKGMPQPVAKEVIDYLENEFPQVTWNIYTSEDWFVKDRDNDIIRHEEDVVKIQSTVGTIEDVEKNRMVDKILCITSENDISNLEMNLQRRFPDLHIVKSGDKYLEVNENGVNKGISVQKMCQVRGIDQSETIGFGDNFNDFEMLHEVGQGVTMRSAVEALKDAMYFITESNNDDGVGRALYKLMRK